MSALVIAEHDHGTLKGATLNTVTAALQCGGEVHVLIAGHNAGGAAQAAAALAAPDEPEPAIRTVTAPPSCLAAVIVLSVAGRTPALSCSAMTSALISAMSVLARPPEGH